MLNQNQTNTTTRPAAYLPAVTATRTARIEAAHSRHAISTAGTWTATPHGIRPPVHRQNPEQLYLTADTAARLALRAREQASGLDLFRQLAQAAPADRTHNSLTATGTAALEAERERDKLREQAAAYRAIAERKTATPAEAKAARAKARALTKAADKAAARAEALNEIIHEATASDRADIVQAAILATLTHDHSGNPDGAFPAMCAAAGKAIGAIASPNALTATRTKVTEIEPDEAAALIATYGHGTKIPHIVKGCTSQCFDTVELRTRGRGEEKRLVWCKVSHYLTVAPYISYEAFTEQSGGDTAEIATNGGINAIGTQEDQAAIADLLERANLTERESLIVYKVADQTAARHGQAAANEYWKERTPQIAALPTAKARREAHKDAQRTADRERIAAQWESAFDRSGVYSQSNRYTTKSRIHKALTAATKPAAPLTEAEQTERERKQMERMQRERRRTYAPEPAAVPDLIGAMARYAAAQPKHKPVVKWVQTTDTAAAVWSADPRQSCPQTLAPSGQHATPPTLTAREQRERDRLARKDEDTAALIAKFEALNA